MVPTPSCFDLFAILDDAVRKSEQRIGMVVCDNAKANVWKALCNQHRALHRDQRGVSRGVTRARPINVRELALVKSCKRRVRW